MERKYQPYFRSRRLVWNLVCSIYIFLAAQASYGCTAEIAGGPLTVNNPESIHRGESVKLQLPRNLGSRAKREVLRSSEGQIVLCVAELAPNTTPKALELELQALEVKVRSWSATTRLLTVELPAARLVDLAALNGVVYVDLAQQYTP